MKGSKRIRPFLKYRNLVFHSSSAHSRISTVANDVKERPIIDPMEITALSNRTADENLRWMIQYNDLKKYGETHQNNCNVPIKHKAILEDGSASNLGSWLQTQRYQFRKGILNENRKMLLQELVDAGQLEWNLKNYGDESWMEHYNALVTYTKQNDGVLHLTDEYEVTLSDGRKLLLGRWLKLQRQYMSRSVLQSDRKLLLQDLLDKCSLSSRCVETNKPRRQVNDLSWNLQYEALLKYGEENNGNCNITKLQKVILSDGSTVSLGLWLCNQRELNKKDKLRSDRKALLQGLVDEGKLEWSFDKGKYNTDDSAWDAKYNALVKYGEEHAGDCNIAVLEKYTLSDGITLNLGQWLKTQRELNKTNKLRPDRKALLQILVDTGKLEWSFDMVECNTNNVAWDAKYAALVKYGEEHDGDCNIPLRDSKKLDDGVMVPLGSWLRGQRYSFKKNELREDRKARLQQLVDEGKLNWAIIVPWEDRYNSLLSYAKVHGGKCEIPVKYDGPFDHGFDANMSAWLQYQKISHKKRLLLPDRERKLQLLVDQGMMSWKSNTNYRS
eukprot:gene9327-19358_t